MSSSEIYELAVYDSGHEWRTSIVLNSSQVSQDFFKVLVIENDTSIVLNGLTIS